MRGHPFQELLCFADFLLQHYAASFLAAAAARAVKYGALQ